MTEDKLKQDYGDAVTRLNNAKQSLESREHRHRKLVKQIRVRELESMQMNVALSDLEHKIEKAKEELKAAKEAYRPLRQQWKLSGRPT